MKRSRLHVHGPFFALALVAIINGVSPIARSADVTPGHVTQVDVFVSGQDGYAAYRIPSLVAAADGSLVALCEGRVRNRSDAGDIDLLAKRSTDCGATWSAQAVVWDDGANTCGNPCAVVDARTGVIWLLMTRNPGDETEAEIVGGGAHGGRTVWITSSRDHGVTWAKGCEITADVKPADWTWYATGPGCGIQLVQGQLAGRLLIPCDHNTADKRRWSHVIVSDDGGQSWQRGGSTPRDAVNECEVVELAGGELHLNMRNYDRSVAARQVAVSDDGGSTWRDQRHEPALVEPICQASIRRIEWPSSDRPGLIAFSNPADAEKRQNLTVRASVDEAASWSEGVTLYAGSSAYSCLARLPNGDIGCLYEADDYGRIVLARVPQSALVGER